MASILLIDDDEMVQSVTRELLELSGYEVLSAETGAEALALARDAETKIDLVLLDLSLPDMEGLKLLPQLTAARPGLKVVISTGSFYEDPAKLDVDPAIKGVLQKPFDLQSLRKMVQESLAA